MVLIGVAFVIFAVVAVVLVVVLASAVVIAAAVVIGYVVGQLLWSALQSTCVTAN